MSSKQERNAFYATSQSPLQGQRSLNPGQSNQQSFQLQQQPQMLSPMYQQQQSQKYPQMSLNGQPNQEPNNNINDISYGQQGHIEEESNDSSNLHNYTGDHYAAQQQREYIHQNNFIGKQLDSPHTLALPSDYGGSAFFPEDSYPDNYDKLSRNQQNQQQLDMMKERKKDIQQQYDQQYGNQVESQDHNGQIKQQQQQQQQLQFQDYQDLEKQQNYQGDVNEEGGNDGQQDDSLVSQIQENLPLEGFDNLLESISNDFKENRVNEALDVCEQTIYNSYRVRGPASFARLFHQILKFLNNEAVNSLNQNLFEKALFILIKCKEFTELSILKNPPALRALTFNNFGCYYRRLMQLPKALGYLEQALRFLTSIKSREYLGMTYLNISAVLSQMGEHYASLENAKKAVVEIHQDYQNYLTRRQFNEAVKEIEFVDICQAMAIAFYNVGVEQEHFQNYEVSLINYGKACEVSEDNLGANHRLTRRFKELFQQFNAKLLKTEKQKGFVGNLPRNNRKLVSRPNSGFPKTFNGNNRNGKLSNSNNEFEGDSDRDSFKNLPPYEQRAFPFKQQFGVRSTDQLQKGIGSRSLNPSRPSTAKVMPKLTITRPASSKTMQIERGGSLNRPGSAMNSGGQYSSGFGKNIRPIQKISAPAGLSRPLSASTQNLPFKPIQKNLVARRPENNNLKKIRRDNKQGEEEPTENIYDWVESNSSEDGETSKRIQANQRDFLKGVQKEAEEALKKLQQEELEVKERIVKLREEAEREEKRKADAILEQKSINFIKKLPEQKQQQQIEEQQSGRNSEDIPEDEDILTEEEIQKKRALSIEKQKIKAQLELQQKLDEETKEKERIAKELARAMQEQKDKEKIEKENLKLKQEREELLQQIQQLQQQSQIQQQKLVVEEGISQQQQGSKVKQTQGQEDISKQNEKQVDNHTSVVDKQNNKIQDQKGVSSDEKKDNNNTTGTTLIANENVTDDKEVKSYLSGLVNQFLEKMYLRAIVSNDYLIKLEETSLDSLFGQIEQQENQKKKDIIIPLIKLNDNKEKEEKNDNEQEDSNSHSSPSQISEESESEREKESDSEGVNKNINKGSKKILKSQQSQEDKSGIKSQIDTDNKQDKSILNQKQDNNTNGSQLLVAEKETLLDKWIMEIQGQSLQLSLFRQLKNRIRICYLLRLQSSKDIQTPEVLYARTIPGCIATTLVKHITPSSKVTFSPLLYLSIGSKINLDIEFTLLGQSIAAKVIQDYSRNGYLNVFARTTKITNIGSQNSIKTSIVISLQQTPGFKKLGKYRVIDESRLMQCNIDKQLFETLLKQKQNKTFSFLEYFNVDLLQKLITVKDKNASIKPQVTVTAANMVIFKESKLYSIDRRLTECCIQVAYRQGEQPSLIFSAIGQNYQELAVVILRKITDKTEIIDFAKSIMRRLYIADEQIKVADEKQLIAAQKLQKFHKMETIVKSQNFQLRINDEHGDINFIQGECHLIRRIGQYSVQLFKYEFPDDDEIAEGKLLHQQTIHIGIIDKAHKQSILQNFQSLVNTNITLENDLLQFEDPNIFTDPAELIIHRMIFN